jgi:hypothetical protein
MKAQGILSLLIFAVYLTILLFLSACGNHNTPTFSDEELVEELLVSPAPSLPTPSLPMPSVSPISNITIELIGKLGKCYFYKVKHIIMLDGRLVTLSFNTKTCVKGRHHE